MIPPSPITAQCPKRGRLQIITGGSKGLSAVRLILEKACAAKAAGIDLIVARVNFRHEPAIKDLLKELECMPEIRGAIDPANGSSLDVRCVQRRAPQLVIVDTSVVHVAALERSPSPVDVYAPWKDIEAIIALGIDVWASLDTSKLSSWVAAVSGRVRSTSEFTPKVRLVELGP